jgi:hypothetical protein
MDTPPSKPPISLFYTGTGCCKGSRLRTAEGRGCNTDSQKCSHRTKPVFLKTLENQTLDIL